MKKRSMLAIASLATGFVVAAVTPSHALGEQLSGLNVGDNVSSLDPVLAHDSLDTAAGDDASGEQEN
ncbi:hypothetical protein [Streptomyces sp. JB150]|uniref:hypothetical protein n=1 Tax=Streptomyces sp. JB150 TaxID=2714844 RepID=UPI0014076E91|nr:hypothetical protein [Streptomyces sp. JB150]QIJ61170.1 hypothetical protein G7Z13_03340 [Streptomyces sp. JB150]